MVDDVRQSLTAVDSTPEGVSARFSFAADLPVFQGHFPELAIVPGIYLIEATRVVCERFRETRLEIARVRDARFTKMLRPDDLIEVTARLDEGEGDLRCEARFENDGEEAARIRLQLRRSA